MRRSACSSLRCITGCGWRGHGWSDFALGAAAFLLLFMWRTPPWLVAVLSAVAGEATTDPHNVLTIIAIDHPSQRSC